MILITGIPRSRTSLTSAIFDQCGAYFCPQDDMVGPHPSNVLGFFESQTVRHTMQRPYFKKIGFDPLARKNMPTAKDIIIDPTWRKRFFQAVPGCTAHKEAKIMLYWEQWHHAFPEAKWVIVRRNREEILESVSKRTSFMKGKLPPAKWEKWIDHHLARMDEMKEIVDWRELDTGRLVQGDFKEIRSIIEWSGLTWTDDAKKLVMPEYTYQVVK